MESLRENKPLLWCIIGSFFAVLALVTGFLPDLANQFAIVEFPADVSFDFIYIKTLTIEHLLTNTII